MNPDVLAPDDRLLWDAMGEAKPRFTVVPTPGAAHELDAVRMVAGVLQRPLIPASAWWVRCMTEKLPNGRYRYPEFTTTVPRQSSKSTTLYCVLVARSLLYPGRRSFYTAQTGKDGAARWGDMADLVEASKFGDFFSTRRGVGSQKIVCDRTKSRIMPFAPTPTSLHGYTPHDVALDEVFAFDSMQGRDLKGAIKPAQQTLRDRQLIMLSTAGHAGSTFLRELVDTGRASILAGSDSIGYVEFSLPDDADPYDEASWAFHPALGHLIELEDLRELAQSTPKGEWQRAFMNQWIDAEDPLLDVAKWRECAGELRPPDLSEVVLGFSRASDRGSAAVVAAWELPDGRAALKLLVHTMDVGSFVTRLVELDERRPLAWAADDGGLDRELVDAVNRALPEHRRFKGLTPREWMNASTGLAAAIEEGRVVHDDDEYLTSGILTATGKPMGEAWALSHRSRPAVIAAAAALRVLVSRPAPDAAPEVHFA